MGGPEVSFDSIAFLSLNKFIDFVIIGEGEGIFSEFTEELHSETPQFEKIKGLTYRMDGKIYVNPPAKVLNFESVPLP